MAWTAGPGARLGFLAHFLLLPLRFCTARGDCGHDVSPTLGPCGCGRGFSAQCPLSPLTDHVASKGQTDSCTRCDPHSLCYNFTIDPQLSPGEPWCVVQGQVDGNVLLSYDCGSSKIQSTSPLGEEVKTTHTWEIQTETLRDIGDFLKWQLPDVILEKHMARGGSGPLTLQARITCRWEEDGHISGSWQFGFNGQMWLLLDSENEHWTVVHSGGRRMKEKWENDRAVTDFLKRVSMTDCRAWLQDFMVRWEEMLKSAASPTTGPSAVQPMATTIKSKAWILPVVLTSFIITVFLG